MGKKSMKHKRNKDDKLPEPGTFRYGWRTHMMPREFMDSYYERLKQKREMKRLRKLEKKKHAME